MTEQNTTPVNEPKRIGIVDFEEKMKKYAVDNTLSESDKSLIEKAKFWRTELYGNGVSGKSFGEYSALELSNLLGTFANFSFSISELELKLRKQFERQVQRNKLKEAEEDKKFRVEYEIKNKKRPTEKIVHDYLTTKMSAYVYTALFKEEIFLSVQNLKWAYKSDIQAMDIRTKVKLAEKGTGGFLDNSVDIPDDIDLSLQQQ